MLKSGLPSNVPCAMRISPSLSSLFLTGTAEASSDGESSEEEVEEEEEGGPSAPAQSIPETTSKATSRGIQKSEKEPGSDPSGKWGQGGTDLESPQAKGSRGGPPEIFENPWLAKLARETFLRLTTHSRFVKIMLHADACPPVLPAAVAGLPVPLSSVLPLVHETAACTQVGYQKPAL